MSWMGVRKPHHNVGLLFCRPTVLEYRIAGTPPHGYPHLIIREKPKHRFRKFIGC